MHIGLLLLLAGKGGFGLFDGEKGKGKGKFEGEDIGNIIDIEPIHELQRPDLTVGDPLEAERQRLKKLRRDCTPYFGGIGITLDFSGRIETVHLGYPAEAHGILVGDVLLSPDVKGEIGTEVLVRIQRGSEILEIPMIRERICVRDVGEKKKP